MADTQVTDTPAAAAVEAVKQPSTTVEVTPPDRDWET